MHYKNYLYAILAPSKLEIAKKRVKRLYTSIRLLPWGRIYNSCTLRSFLGLIGTLAFGNGPSYFLA